MYILGLILLILGVIFISFGYFIYFKQKYNLINNFDEDFKHSKIDENYAKRIGLIEMLWGIIFITFFLMTRIIPDYSIILLLIGVIGLIVSLVINHFKSSID